MATNIQTLIEEFKQGKHNELLKDIYVDEAVIEYQQERYIKALESFATIAIASKLMEVARTFPN